MRRPAPRTVALPSGERVVLRAVEPADALLVVEFVAGLSPTTRYRRAFTPFRSLPPEVIRRLVEVDFERDMALIAVQRGADGREAMMGASRYVRDLEGDGAEFALTVADRWHRQGLGSRLMQALIEEARARGVDCLHGLVLRSNRPMVALARRLGFKVSAVRGDATTVEAVKEI